MTRSARIENRERLNCGAFAFENIEPCNCCDWVRWYCDPWIFIFSAIDRISKEEVTINENLFAACSKLADFLAQEKYEPVGNETKRQRWKNICRVYDNEGTCRQFLFYSFVFWRYFAPRPITIVWPNIYKRIERSIDDFAVSKSQRFPSRRGRNRTRS